MSEKLPAPAIPKENFIPIKRARNLEELFLSAEFRERIVASVPRHVTPERMLSTVLRAHAKDPLLLKASPMSFAGACLTCTNVGLEPNSALNESYLIPFRRTIKGKLGAPDREMVEIQVIFGYSGLLKLVYNTKQVRNISANVVYGGADVFDWMEGTDTFLKFKRGGRRERRPDDKPEYAYFHANLADGGQSIEVWPWGDVLKIRNGSQAYRRALRAFEESRSAGRRPPLTWTAAPWVAYEEPMGRKTMIRAGAKYLPKSAELAAAVRIDEMTDRRDIDYSRIIDVAGDDANPDYATAATTLADQSEHQEDDDQGTAPDSGFTDRRPAQTQTEPKPKEEPKPVTPPAFEHFLLDEVGDYDPDPFVDPVEWAKGFVALYSKARDKATLIENNEQALEIARAFPIADQLLAVMNDLRDLPMPTALVVKLRRDNKPDWSDYTNSFRVTAFGWRGDLTLWLAMQRGAMENAPLPVKLLLVKIARERAGQVRTDLPPWVAGLVVSRTPVDSTPTEDDEPPPEAA